MIYPQRHNKYSCNLNGIRSPKKIHFDQHYLLRRACSSVCVSSISQSWEILIGEIVFKRLRKYLLVTNEILHLTAVFTMQPIQQHGLIILGWVLLCGLHYIVYLV